MALHRARDADAEQGSRSALIHDPLARALLPTLARLSASGYPFLVLTFVGWVWTGPGVLGGSVNRSGFRLEAAVRINRVNRRRVGRRCFTVADRDPIVRQRAATKACHVGAVQCGAIKDGTLDKGAFERRS